jgi:hypothetical protein
MCAHHHPRPPKLETHGRNGAGIKFVGRLEWRCWTLHHYSRKTDSDSRMNLLWEDHLLLSKADNLSDDTLSTVDSDVSSVSSSLSSLELLDDEPLLPGEKRRRKTALFSCHPDGSPRCYTHIVERFDDPDLWWSDDEMTEIRKDCYKIVSHYKGRHDRVCESVNRLFRLSSWIQCHHPMDDIVFFLQDDLDPQVGGRGLEHHILGSYKDHVTVHRIAVLALQASGQGESSQLEAPSPQSRRLLEREAARTAQACQRLAHKIAFYDTQAALE